MKKLFKRSVWTLLTVFFAFLFIMIVVASQIAQDYVSWVDQYFGIDTRYQLVNKEENAESDTQYFKSEFALKDENGKLVLEKNDNGIEKQTFDDEAMQAYCRNVVQETDNEGSVLLWNKENALPLAEGSKVSLFGSAINNWTYTGLGSGHVGALVPPNLVTSLSTIYSVNPDLPKAYETLTKYGYNNAAYNINEPNWSTIQSRGRVSNLDASVASYGDAAIVTFNRPSGEEGDVMIGLKLTDAELDILDNLLRLKSAGQVKRIILLINSANALALNGVQDRDIDACLWVGFGGARATDSVADLLVGKVDPSGRTTDTWVYSGYSAPAMANFGDHTMSNADGIVKEEKYDRYVVYQEGIYVGYRYYETRYEDYVLGKGGASSANGSTTGSAWKYSDEVVSPFGSGESYTAFSYGKISVKRDGKDYVVSVPVTNTGNVAGKEVVQIYLQKPYTQYDKDNKVEKAAVELVGFDKTALLDPGKSETVEITVPEYEFKSYDSYGKKTYILEAGDYYLTAGKNAHDAVNNILAAKGLSAEEKARMDGEGNTDLVYKTGYSRDVDDYALSPYTGERITNQFDNADINLYEGTKDQKIVYLTRNDWENTWPASAVSLSANSDVLRKDLALNPEVETNAADTMPTYGTVTSKYGKLTLVQLMGIPYDDPLWEDLLNQMTYEEQIACLRTRLAGAESIAAPGGSCIDGPCGQVGNSDGLAFSCEPILASTFNRELVEKSGNAFGTYLMQHKKVGLFGPGANTHRTIASGRNWEYWSEDGFLGGVMNAMECRGLTSMGIVVFDKHFALNDQETNRMTGVMTFANEQSIREIYLKSFETGMASGDVNGIMTSFNRIGTTWSGGHKGLLTNVSRNEWGFKGPFLTDAGDSNICQGSADHKSIFAASLIAGQTMWYTNMKADSLDGYKDNATVMQALREAVHRQLYAEANSVAMNGISSTTESIYVTPAWEITLLAVEIVVGILAGLCLAMTVTSWIVWAKRRKQNNV